MGNTCEALVVAFWIDVFEANGMLSVEEAIELQHKIFEGKEVAGRILRVSEKNQKYTIGCQTYNEHPEVYTIE